MGLSRLTHERYARMKQDGTFPAVPEPPPANPTPEPTPALMRGGRSQDSRAYQVMAMVRRVDGAIDWEFVTEDRRLSAAIVSASRYQFRAVVVSPHSKREFDNGKAIEQDGATR